MMLMLCIDASDTCGYLTKGKVYEVLPSTWGPTYIRVPSAMSPVSDHYWKWRFVPINDADVKDDIRQDEEITA